MDKKEDTLHVGSSINIKRTDGRIHSAIVASINANLKNVTVEWFEQGETKGKEVDMEAIYSLNSNIKSIRPEEPCVRAPSTAHDVPVPGKLQKDSSASSEEEISGAMAQSGRFSHKLDESDDDLNSNQYSPETATLSNPTRATIGGHYGNNDIGLGRQQISSSNGHSNDINRGESNIPTTSRSNLRVTNVGPSNNGISNQSTMPLNDMNRESNIPTTSRTSNIQNFKRPNVVKEVEKLKKNREERRQRQAEERAEKEAFLQLAPGNPHWELLNMIREYRRGLDIKPLSENDVIEDHLITVCVRKRPLNRKEITRKEVDVITIPSKNQLIVHEPKNKVDLTKYLENQLFRFDYAFDETCSNEMVYRYTAQPLIKTIFDGGFATCFAYGQTGSGKTHTMGGDFNGKSQDCQKGIYAMASADVFKLAKSPKYRHKDFCISASFFEIYSGKVFDLLNNKAKLRVLEDGKQQVQVVGLTEIVVVNSEAVLKLIQKGNQARTSGQTFANSNSSRSHAVFQIYLRSQTNMQKIHGKFSLIDLAGNERGADTSSANRQTRMEGAEINKSLLALKECIRALGRKGAHLPFRVSKLTQVLRDSFVGSNSRTCMIAMLSPGVNSCEHTLNTLRYADRVKELGGGDLQTADSEQPQGGSSAADLQQLRSLNDNDMSQEMLNLHQVISELEVAEENMLDVHKQVTEELFASSQNAVQLLRMTDEVAYDQEAYCKNWKNMVDNIISMLAKSQEVVEDYMAKMSTEEQLSRTANN